MRTDDLTGRERVTCDVMEGYVKDTPKLVEVHSTSATFQDTKHDAAYLLINTIADSWILKPYSTLKVRIGDDRGTFVEEHEFEETRSYVRGQSKFETAAVPVNRRGFLTLMGAKVLEVEIGQIVLDLSPMLPLASEFSNLKY